jgi:hypothetical protein
MGQTRQASLLLHVKQRPFRDAGLVSVSRPSAYTMSASAARQARSSAGILSGSGAPFWMAITPPSAHVGQRRSHLFQAPSARNFVASRLYVWLSHLKQGAVSTVKRKHHAGTVGGHTKLPRPIPASLCVEEAVRTANTVFLAPPSDRKEPAYKIPRRAVQVQVALRGELAV